MKKLTLLCLLFYSVLPKLLAQVTVSYGGNDYFFSNLGGSGEAFEYVNSISTPTQLVEIKITSSFSEVANPAYLFCNGSISKIRIFPTSTNATITQSNPNRSVISIFGADNVTIDGRLDGWSFPVLVLVNLQTGGRGVTLWGGAQFDSVKYTTIMLGSNSDCGVVIERYAFTCGFNQSNRFNYIYNNSIDGGNEGIRDNSIQSPTLPANEWSIIANNFITNPKANGISVSHESISCQITGNTVTSSGSAISGNKYGIFYNGYGTSTISNNIIQSLDIGSIQAGVHGIAILLSSTGSSVITIANNHIAMNMDNENAFNVTGLSISASASQPLDASIYHNTVRLSGDHNLGTGSCDNCAFRFTGNSSSTLKCKNNLFINRRYGPSPDFEPGFSAEYSLPYSCNYEIDYNDYYSRYSFQLPGPPLGPLVIVNSVLYSRIEDLKKFWCDCGIEQNSVSEPVSFVSDADLHIAGPVGGDLFGIPLPGFTLDIDNQPRHVNEPFKGADEKNLDRFYFTLGVSLEGRPTSGSLPAELRLTLRNPFSPHSAIADATSYLSNSAYTTFVFGDALLSYASAYFVVNTCTHLETWSSAPVPFATSLTYDFTTAAGKAYGNNMTLFNGLWSFYAGDINNDGVIDITDLSEIENDASGFTAGCRECTDLTYDGVVDGSDYILVDNNSYAFVLVSSPP